jgi:hypothetical protein
MSGLDESYFMYVIAGGETLELIKRLKSAASNAQQELGKIAQKYGASVTFNSYGHAFFKFDGALPEGWQSSHLFGTTPNQDTPLGQQIAREIGQQTNKLDVRYQFNEACARSCGTSRGSGEYFFEEIGDKIIVGCPPEPGSNLSTYFIPPDSTPITFSQYAKMKEEAGLLSTTTAKIKPFQKKFDI